MLSGYVKYMTEGDMLLIQTVVASQEMLRNQSWSSLIGEFPTRVISLKQKN